MATTDKKDVQQDLRKRSEKIATLVEQFNAKMQNLRTRQRQLLERVFNRIDQEKAEQIRKSIMDIQS